MLFMLGFGEKHFRWSTCPVRDLWDKELCSCRKMLFTKRLALT